MRIIVEYESSWRNSFLDGSNDEALPKKGRNFIASMTELKKPENFYQRTITKNTVMGVLSRLIGDQRKLYMARQSEHYYFADKEQLITFEDKPEVINHEIAYIRNITGSEDKKSFVGMIKVNTPIFQSNYSYAFWGVLSLDIEQLCDFILDEKPLEQFEIDQPISLDPVSIINRLEMIAKIKPMQAEGRLKQASDKLVTLFKDYKPLNAKGLQLALAMYCSTLYLQMQRLEKQLNISIPKASRGGISGISNNMHTPKDFMAAYVTGGKKKVYGNPYLREEFVKGEGKINHKLTKASGQLEITIDVEANIAKELKTMIEDAGVSAFYVGKKGLAYVSEIRLR